MKKYLLPLSILVLAGAIVVAAAIWGVVTDREGQRRDQPPWSQYERRYAPGKVSNPKPIDCANRPKPTLDPDFGPGGVFDTGGPYKPRETEIDQIIYRGCPPQEPAQ